MIDGTHGRPRLADVAERAGVSKKTVSNVVNDFPFVTADTRGRVLAAIEELGYRPNQSARDLARGRTGVIALAIPELDMPYFSELARHVIEVADRYSWTVLIEQTLSDRDREQRVVDGELSRRIDGLLFSPLRVSAGALKRRSDKTPLVLLGEHLYDGTFDHVSIDNVAAARAATEHLVERGRRRIAAIGDRRTRTGGAAQRLEGYRAALATVDVTPEPGWVPRVPTNRGDAGERAMEELLDLDEPPDAVFCFTDLLALGALRAIRRRGLRVPEDIALVGFDDTPYGRVAWPALTTVAPDKLAIAERAVELLDRRLSSRRAPGPTEARVDFRLVVRESS